MTIAAASSIVQAGALGAIVALQLGDTATFACSGTADLAGSPLTENTLFDVASVTKVAATTSALHRLVALDELGLDDAVERYLPTSPCAPGTSVRELLLHRAGLWEWQPLYLAADPELVLDEMPLRSAPGEQRRYSDLGFMILGKIVAAIAATPFDEAVAALVHRPLGMVNTSWGPVRGDVASSALGDAAERRMVETGTPYPVIFDDDDFVWRDAEICGDVNDGNAFHAFGGVSGHAGLFSSAPDLLRLGASLAASELDPFWGEKVSAEMFRDGPDRGQALGWRSMPVRHRGDRRRLLWHPGFTGCALGFLPGENLTVTMLSNRLFAPNLPAVESLWRSVLANVPDLEPLTESEA